MQREWHQTIIEIKAKTRQLVLARMLTSADSDCRLKTSGVVNSKKQPLPPPSVSRFRVENGWRPTASFSRTAAAVCGLRIAASPPNSTKGTAELASKG